jgi:NAD(P)-dependent dehydrogenase (short-subunit alcohol dehydrogenase family)
VVSDLAERLGGAASPHAVDVTNPHAVEQAVRAAAEVLGGLDAVVNAAAIALPTPLEALDASSWRATVDTNLSGSFYVSRSAAPILAEGEGGVIVNIGSELSTIGMAGFVHYCAAKAGVVGLTKALAAELAPQVRVNVVCPGAIDTPMMEGELALTDDPVSARRSAIERVPLKRFASAEEIARAIRFLAFEAGYATGNVLTIDGGTTIGA